MKFYGDLIWRFKTRAVAVAAVIGLAFSLVGPTSAASAHQAADDGDAICEATGNKSGELFRSYIVIEEANADEIHRINDGQVCAYFETAKDEVGVSFRKNHAYVWVGECGQAGIDFDCDGLKALKLSDIDPKECIVDDSPPHQVLADCRIDIPA